MIRKDDKLTETSWEEALKVAADKIKEGAALGLAMCATTNEALDAFAKLFEKFEGKAGLLEPTAPELGYGTPAKIQDVLDADFIVVAGAQPLEYQRVIGYFIHRAADKGATLAVISESENALSERADMMVPYAEADKIAKAAAEANKLVLVYSVGIKPEAIEAFKSLGDKVHFLALDPARNAKGAEAAGLAPMELEKADTLFFLLGEQSEDDALLSKVNGAFTVVQASYYSPLVECADVVLPGPIWAERTGHVTNLEGKVFVVNPVLPMPEGIRDDAEVLASLAEKL